MRRTAKPDKVKGRQQFRAPELILALRETL